MNGACVAGGTGGGSGGVGGGSGGVGGGSGGVGGGVGGGGVGGGSGGVGGGSGGVGGGSGGVGGGSGGVGGGGGAVACSAANCGGCCTSANTCQPTAVQGIGSCGIGGNACQACLGGQTCNNGVCGTASVAVGATCTMNSQCASLGTNAKCKLTTSTNFTYPQGYCTLPCTGQAQGNCPTGNTCSQGFGLDLFGEYEQVCLANCPNGGTQSTCRTGYTCYVSGAPAGAGICWLDPLPAYDAGQPPNKLGFACTTASDCANPPNSSFAICYPDPASAQGSIFPGGYCMSYFNLDGSQQWGGINGCGPSGIYLPLGTTQNPFDVCIATCNNPGQGKTQRPGGGVSANQYSCYSLNFADGGPTPFGYLFPSCDAPNNGCASLAGSTCNTTNGYCCFADGGCRR